MAKLPQLVSAIAASDERPRETLDWIARVIREGGELPTTKRGSGASDMSFSEAAKLLIGVSVAEAAPKTAALQVPRYWALEGDNYSPNKIDGGVFKAIEEAPNFGIALTTLIAGAFEIRMALAKYVTDAYGEGRTAEQLKHMKANLIGGMYASVEVIFGRPTPAAIIRVVAHQASQPMQFEWRYRMSAELMEAGCYPSYPMGNPSSTRTIRLKTLVALWGAIVGDLEDPEVIAAVDRDNTCKAAPTSKHNKPASRASKGKRRHGHR